MQTPQQQTLPASNTSSQPNVAKVPITPKTSSKSHANRGANDASRKIKNNSNNAVPKSTMVNTNAVRKDNNSASNKIPSNVRPSQTQTSMLNSRNTSPPQEIAVVAGRKYIMVPKKSLALSGKDTNVNGLAHANEVQKL